MPVGNEQEIPVVGTTPSLQAVTDAGNTTTNALNSDGGFYVPTVDYLYYGISDESVVYTKDRLHIRNPVTEVGGEIGVSNLTVNRGYELPDQSGTIALLSDITGGTGITRSINNISGNTTAGATAATDYVYFCTGTFTLTLPTCVSNTNRYTVKCISGTLTVSCNGAQTIDGTTTISVAVEDSVDIISNNTEWKIV
jgi:hypothetical protein